MKQLHLLLFSRIGVLALIGVATLSGCGDPPPKGPPRVETFSIIGTVLIDGKAAEPPILVAVRAHPEGGVDQSPTHTMPSAIASPDGSFTLSTYERGDGVPPGTYKITFQAGKTNFMSGKIEGDAFDGKYNDPETSEYTVTVTGSETEPIDLGTIDLTSP